MVIKKHINTVYASQHAEWISLGIELGLPIPQRLELRGGETLEVGVAVGRLGAHQRKGPCTFMAGERIHACIK